MREPVTCWALLPLPVDLDDDEAERREEEHAGGDVAAAAAVPEPPPVPSSRPARSSRGCRASGWRSSGRRWRPRSARSRAAAAARSGRGHLRLVDRVPPQRRAHLAGAHVSQTSVDRSAPERPGGSPTIGGPPHDSDRLPFWAVRLSGKATGRSTAGTTGTADSLALSVHGPAGVLDLVVPAAASAADVAREYARQSGLGVAPRSSRAPASRCHPTSRWPTPASTPARSSSRAPSPRPRRPAPAGVPTAGRASSPGTGALSVLWFCTAAAAAVLAGWLAAHEGRPTSAR